MASNFRHIFGIYVLINKVFQKVLHFRLTKENRQQIVITSLISDSY